MESKNKNYFEFKFTKKRFYHILSLPFIYMMIFPAIVLHLFLEIYHSVCFRLYGIKLVDRKNYFLYDRNKLGYLKLSEKINCAFCSYFNGLMAYGVEIAGRTEQYWCPIKHEKNRKKAHHYYDNFFDYKDGGKYRAEIDVIREDIQSLKHW